MKEIGRIGDRNFKRRDLILFGGSLLTVASFQQILNAQDRRGIVELAEKVTVRIITPGSPGSGVIVRKTGNTYIVLTAAHVIKETNPGEEAYIQTFDGEQHQVDTSSIRIGRNVDLALVVFQTEKKYRLAELGDSKSIARLDEIYVAGFPLPDQGITNPSFTIDSGKVNSIGAQKDGYEITYTAVTKPGMSGGPVLDSTGKLVGIHGRASGDVINGVREKSGFNLAIPINTAISQFSLKTLKASTPKQQSSPSQQVDKPDTSSGLQRFTFEVVRVNARGQIVDRQSKSAQYFREDLGNGITLDMVLIPGGSFMMGAPNDEESFPVDQISTALHKQLVPTFFMGKFEITQSQWQAFMDKNPSKFKGNQKPVEQVSWNDAEKFCRRLTRKSRHEYRLPTEAEWEYACRAGTMTPFYYGKTITTDLANYRGVDAKSSNSFGFGAKGNYGFGPKGKFLGQTTEVGSFFPNDFGLYDMHGNVSEWCQSNLYEDETRIIRNINSLLGKKDIDRSDRKKTKERILRGGSWDAFPVFCRSAYRNSKLPDESVNTLGFRVACSAPSTLQ